MDVDYIPFKETGYFSELICDYLDENKQLEPFYNRFTSLESFKQQIEEKLASFPKSNRVLLKKALERQNKILQTSKLSQKHIKLLAEENTCTVVTGHQLNLFTGPLYFLYKIISTINLCKELSKKYPKYNFVPVYWMATEDHDFDEINYFNFQGKKLQWNHDASGAVGHLKTEGLESVYEAFKNELGTTINAKKLATLFQNAYLNHNTLTEATRFLANELFGSHGLVILDGDDKELKSLLMPLAEKDIFDGVSHSLVTKASNELKKCSATYTIQVNPREINYFYLKDGIRERLVREEDKIVVNNTDISFTPKELLAEMKSNPEYFSPNVITRPIYQELVLPNLCYIGGGGELAYWLQLKESFNAYELPFPILLLRNSVLLISQKQEEKIKRLHLEVADLFNKQSTFINKKIREISNIDINFTPQKEHLEAQFKSLYELAKKTDKSFLGAVKAQEIKQIKGLNHLEKRLLNAQKRKLRDQVIRMTDIQNQLFPNASLQERQLNFSEIYLELGEDLIPSLIQSLNPLKMEFTILRY